MTFYGLEVPEIGDYAIGVIIDIQETVGYFLTLPEYNDIRAFVGLRDVSRCRYKKLKGIVKEGNIEVVEITSIDGNNIDASRKNLETSRVEDCMSRFRSYKRIFDWLKFTEFYDQSTKDDYISQVLHRPGQSIPQHLIGVHEKLSKLTEPAQELVISQEIRIPAVSECPVGLINAHLESLRERYALDITVAVTRKSTYRVIPKQPLPKEDMEALLQQILQDEETHEDYADHRENQECCACDGKQPTVNIGIIGHVSHGKSTIVNCLTGVDTRRHKKEIQSNRTLHLGYTNVKVTECKCNSRVEYISGQTDCACQSVLASIVDCPGHHVLLSTMISGAHIMDTCIAVIAANQEVPQKQTEEHIDVVQIIGKTQEMLVVQNKVDIPNITELRANHTQIVRFLKECDLEDSFIVPVSAQKAINCAEILKWVYMYVKQHDDNAIMNDEEECTDSYGIVVRTFDINKPGARDVQGIVVGGSVSRGKFCVGQEILILPQRIKTHIISLRSDATAIAEARPGGLIAVQTDMNPSFTDSLVGCTFTVADHFQPHKLLAKDSLVEARYYMHKDSPIPSLKPGLIVNLNVLAQRIACTVVSCRKTKCELQIHSSVYLHDGLEFLMTRDRRLIGYGRDLRSPRGKQLPQPINLPSLAKYEDLLEQATEMLRSVECCKVHLPIPKTVYLNTFTTCSNFANICEKLYAKPHKVGLYIHNELGTRSWSVNNQNQLILKGRSNENRIMTVLRPFITHKKCESCNSLDTEIFTDRGVKKQKCNACSWTDVKKTL